MRWYLTVTSLVDTIRCTVRTLHLYGGLAKYSIFNIFSILNYDLISISIRPHTDIEYWWKPWLAEEAPIQSARSGYMLASRAVSRWIRFLARAIRYFHTLYSHSVISWKFRSWSFEMGVCYSEFFNPRERMNAYPFSVDFVYNRYKASL